MTTRARSIALLALGLAVTGLYVWRLPSAPIYLAHDEVFFAVQAQTVASTLHDTNGKFLPLYFHMGTIYWCSPLHVYLAALLLRFVHISDGVIRIPSVVAGLVTIGLMYFVGRRLFTSAWYGALAAAILALTPAEFIASRFKVESHFPLPFLVGWMLCVLVYQDTRRTRWLAAGGLTLGFGLYGYHAAPMMMPIYVALTLWLLWTRGELRLDRAAAIVGTFALLAAPYAIFVLTHPEYIQGEVNLYGVYDASHLSPLQGVGQLVNWAAARARLNVYYEYFNPSLLFFSGGSAIIESTQVAGVFLLPMAVLLPLGAYRIVAREPRAATMYLMGFVTAPLAASVVLEGGATRRILFMLPFAAIIAVYGFRQLLDSPKRSLRLCAAALLLALPLQFAYFYADYLGDYRTRSAIWFERDVRGALEAAIDAAARADGSPRIFVSSQVNDYVTWYWTFYTLKHDRTDLAARTTFFDTRTAGADFFPADAIIVAEAGARDRLTAGITGLTELARTPEPGGPPSFYVWSRGSGRAR